MEYGHTLYCLLTMILNFNNIKQYVSQSLTYDCIFIYLEKCNLFIHINATVSNAVYQMQQIPQ